MKNSHARLATVCLQAACDLLKMVLNKVDRGSDTYVMCNFKKMAYAYNKVWDGLHSIVIFCFKDTGMWLIQQVFNGEGLRNRE